MSDDLHDVNDLMDEVNKLSIRTSQGSFVKTEDVEKLIKKRKEALAITEAEVPERMTKEQARERAKKFLGDQDFGQKGPAEPGRSVSAQPSSRT